MSNLWPLGILLVSNVMYNVCAKSLPQNLNPIASLSAIYAIAIVISVVLYYVIVKDANILMEYKKMNWTTIALGFCVVGMEIGTMYLYRVGWPISVGMLINNSLVAIGLIIIGYLFFHEVITISKIAGLACFVAGIYLVNK